jgi:hypothetical protein
MNRIALALLLLAAPASGEWENVELSVGLSAHIGGRGDYNPVHPHIRYTDGDYSVGAFINSESRLSPYVSRRHGIFEYGIAGGYPAFPVVPFVRVSHDVAPHISIFAAPAYDVDHGPIGVVGVEFKL